MFECNVGVRQGENLSPLLFSLHLNDHKEEFSDKFQGLPFLDNMASDMTGTKWNAMSSFFLLLYTDDTSPGARRVLFVLFTKRKPYVSSL